MGTMEEKFFAAAAKEEQPVQSSIQPCPACGKPKHKREMICPSCGFGATAPRESAKRKAPVLREREEPEEEIVERPVQTIEKTSKKWKAMMLNGYLLSFIGMILLIVGIVNGSAIAGIGGAATLFGCCMVIYARMMAWWHHG